MRQEEGDEKREEIAEPPEREGMRGERRENDVDAGLLVVCHLGM